MAGWPSLCFRLLAFDGAASASQYYGDLSNFEPQGASENFKL